MESDQEPIMKHMWISDPERQVSAADLATMMDVTERTARDWLRKEGIPAPVIDGSARDKRWRWGDLERFWGPEETAKRKAAMGEKTA